MASSISLATCALSAEVAGQHVHARAELGGELLELVDLAAGDGDRGALLVQGAGDGRRRCRRWRR